MMGGNEEVGVEGSREEGPVEDRGHGGGGGGTEALTFGARQGGHSSWPRRLAAEKLLNLLQRSAIFLKAMERNGISSRSPTMERRKRRNCIQSLRPRRFSGVTRFLCQQTNFSLISVFPGMPEAKLKVNQMRKMPNFGKDFSGS